MPIRDFDRKTDFAGVRACLIELQDFERAFDPRMPPGADIVDEYVRQMFARCRKCQGKVLIADVDGQVAGYATILTTVKSEQLEDGDFEYGLVSDLMVLERHRNSGLGTKLLAAAESYARACEVRWLRIGVLVANRNAERLYLSRGFSGQYVELEKDLARSS